MARAIRVSPADAARAAPDLAGLRTAYASDTADCQVTWLRAYTGDERAEMQWGTCAVPVFGVRVRNPAGGDVERRYVYHRPEAKVLYDVVERHQGTFFVHVEEEGRRVPGFVRVLSRPGDGWQTDSVQFAITAIGLRTAKCKKCPVGTQYGLAGKTVREMRRCHCLCDIQKNQ